MASFAHIVGFRHDRTTALHIHPEQAGPLTPSDRGGPELHFRFYTAKAGFYRLFAQVQYDGAEKFASFDLNVAPGPLPLGGAQYNCSSEKSSPAVYGLRVADITAPATRRTR